MAISTAAAIIGGSLIAGGGAAIAAGKSNSAANKAADTAAANTAANNALTEKIYNQNASTLAPFVQTGTAAGALLNDFYGIPQTAAPTAGGSPDYAAYVQANPDIAAEFQQEASAFGNDMGAFGQFHYNTYGKNEGRALPGAAQTAITAQPGQASQSAFANYLKNSDFAFQQQEGGNQVNSGYAGAGTVQSGAAMRALERYRQNLQSGYRQQWASGVANQQGVGLGAASALAGVSTNFGNTIAASNTAAADARANAALSQQSGLGNALGMFGAGILKGFG